MSSALDVVAERAQTQTEINEREALGMAERYETVVDEKTGARWPVWLANATWEQLRDFTWAMFAMTWNIPEEDFLPPPWHQPTIDAIARTLGYHLIDPPQAADLTDEPPF